MMQQLRPAASQIGPVQSKDHVVEQVESSPLRLVC